MRPLVRTHLGEDAFSGVNKLGNPMGYFSALHFEALALGVQRHLARLVAGGPTQKAALKTKLAELKRDPEFQKLTKGGGKNYAAALKQRIEFVEQRVI